MVGHWEQRTGLPYYAIVRRWLEKFGPQESLLDIGCLDTPVASWGTFCHRFTIDPRPRPAIEGVVAIRGSWPEDKPPGMFDVITCLQTLEHVEDPESFVQPIFEVARLAVILSVPYRWPAGYDRHIHDPVDEKKLRSWTGRDPDRQEVTDSKARRLVTLYRIT